MSAEYLLNLFERRGNLFLGVGGHKAESDKSVVRCYCRRNDRIDEYTLFEEIARDSERLEVVADKERYDRRRRIADLTAHIPESIESIIGEFPEILLTLRLVLHDLHGLERSSRRRGRDARSEDI